jgi:two-component system chemotaxis sensor kinase CheA
MERDIPCVRLSRFFGKVPKRGQAPVIYYGIVAGLAERRLCIVVDRLIEEQDVVIKPLSRILKAKGIAGATDMGEKGTVLVLDAIGMLRSIAGMA